MKAMVQNLVSVVLVALVMNVFGEQHLRGQPGTEGSLATEATLAIKPADQQKTLISFMRGLVTRQNPSSQREKDREDAKALIDFKEMAVMNTGEMFLSFVVWLILYALMAAYYHNNVRFYAEVDEDMRKEEEAKGANIFEDFKDFRSGLCGCNQYLGITFWACCCPNIRWADTMSKLNIHDFWKGFWLLTAVSCIMWFPLCTPLCFISMVGYMTYHRQEFRTKFEFYEQGGPTVATDCLAYTCCMPCAVAQEARHTRDACHVGHPAIRPDSARKD